MFQPSSLSLLWLLKYCQIACVDWNLRANIKTHIIVCILLSAIYLLPSIKTNNDKNNSDSNVFWLMCNYFKYLKCPLCSIKKLKFACEEERSACCCWSLPEGVELKKGKRPSERNKSCRESQSTHVCFHFQHCSVTISANWPEPPLVIQQTEVKLDFI